jgi:hypothetical protein
MNRLLELRAVEMADIPGGDTDLLVRDLTGDVEVYTVDVDLLRELRAHERQAGQELGQWMEADDPHENVVPLRKPNFAKLPAEKLRALEEIYAEAERLEPDAEAA